MTISLEDALVTVWRQSLVENKKTVLMQGCGGKRGKRGTDGKFPLAFFCESDHPVPGIASP
jgi:hypothetical protein